MNIMKRKCLRAFLKRWRKVGSRTVHSAAGTAVYCCCQWALWTSMHEESCLPKDVPKGHLVVYVGENHKRFVIEVTILNHPLFRALLDQAQEEYDFTADSKLCIPCNESLFLCIVRCASCPESSRFFLDS